MRSRVGPDDVYCWPWSCIRTSAACKLLLSQESIKDPNGLAPIGGQLRSDMSAESEPLSREILQGGW